MFGIIKKNDFKTVIQEFLDKIQLTNNYQESAALSKYFGNWVNEIDTKTGLGIFIKGKQVKSIVEIKPEDYFDKFKK
jgi:hypothetical protein